VDLEGLTSGVKAVMAHYGKAPRAMPKT
jgi:hypothetical protein